MTQTRLILTYGVIAGLVLELVFLSSFIAGAPSTEWGMVVGYLTMFIALGIAFVGVKRYRDVELGGVIRFWPAFWLALGMTMVASLFYVLGWEAYLAISDSNFIADYMAGYVDDLRAAGASAAEIAAAEAESAELVEKYSNPFYRMPLTWTEIAPVVLVVPLVSAALLRNPRFLPKTA
ncbi:DUF4199 domain-containing protein [Aurantiacibacter gilvus]|uniref:DUF4199 domain-containing protein n=1 Tax=Aurantiacibacter gilvus TaxID=3139141 RepID=A0ABU9IEA4_9SPHN